MNVFDWLSALPLHDSAKPYPVIEVTFNNGSRKDFYRNNTGQILEKGDWVTLEGVGGYDVGQISLTGELVKLQMKKYGIEDQPAMKRVLRPATDQDIEMYNRNKEREQEVLVRSRSIARNLKLDMKLAEVEIQADGKKATFFYTADNRVDFRELIKLYASDFKVKVEMRQIGARQESGKVGGIGSCGRELCCSTWLTDFKSVNTTAARYQNLSINQTKLSGQCGRLKCCLNYELDTYMDALSMFPDNADSIQTIKGTANLQKRDIFKNLMWYSYSDSNKQYPLSIERVKEIIKLNREGIRPEELQPVELEVNTNKAGLKVDMGFVNDVGQISLKALEKGNKKSNKKGGNKQQQGKDQQRAQGGSQQQAQGGQQPRGERLQRPQGQGGQQQPRPERLQKPQQPAEGKQQPRPQQQQGQRPQQQRTERPQRPQPQGGGQQPQRPQQAQGGQQQPRPERQPRPQQQQGQGQQGGGANQQRNRPQRPPQNRDAKPQSGETPKTEQ